MSFYMSMYIRVRFKNENLKHSGHKDFIEDIYN